MTFLEAKEELCRKLNTSWDNIRAGTNDLYNWDDIDSWVNLAIQEVWDYHRWIFSEKAYTTSTVASQEYYDYPDDFISDSIYLLRITDSQALYETYKKIRFQDYIKYREDTPTGENALWADHNRQYFVNPERWNNTAGRTIEIHGRMRCDNLTSSTGLLPFSTDSDNEENAGNHAIVKLAYAMVLDSEKKNNPNKATKIRQEAYQTFEILAKREREDLADYEAYERPFFKRQTLFGGGGGTQVLGDDYENKW